MKQSILSAFLFLSFLANGQISYRMRLLSNYNDSLLPKVDVTDIWNDLTGYHDPSTNREYIIAGSTDSIYFFDITDAKNMKLVDRRGGGSYFARNRDFETFKNYAYCVADQASGLGGLQIFDLSYLPDSVHPVYESNELGTRTHTIFIDSIHARMYMCMNTKPGGYSAMDIISVERPDSPSFLAELNVPKDPDNFRIFQGVHEMFVRNDTAYLSCQDAGLFIFDLTDLNQQKLISSIINYPDKGYNHSSWLDKSGKYLMFTDENMSLDIKIYDMTSFSDPKFVSQFNSNALATPHNAYWYGDFAYVSSYHDGVRVYNVKDPANPYMVAWYDTHPVTPESYGGYKGCWGVYPFLPSKHIIASDLTSGIFVFEVDSELLSAPEILKQTGTPQVYPNPFDETLTLVCLPETRGTLSIRSLDGNELYSDVFSGDQTTINLSFLKSGMYLLTLQTNSGYYTQKIARW